MENQTEPKSITIDYSIKGLSVKQFIYNEEAILPSPKEYTEERWQVQGEMQHTFAAPLFSVTLILSITESITPDSPIVKMTFETVFNIQQYIREQDASHTTLNDSEANTLPTDFIAMLVGTSYSTARGILWTRLATTPLQSFILPMIDPFSTVKNTLTTSDHT